MFLIVQVLFSLVLIFAAHSWITLLRMRKKLGWIPAAPRVPILGSIREFGPHTETLKDIARLTDNPSKLCYVELLYKWGVVVKNYDFMEFVLSSNAILDKSLDYRFMECWLGTGLLTAAGPKWKQRRRIITPAFHFSILEQFVEVFESNGKILIEKLAKEVADKESVDIYKYVTACALDIISESAMGVSVNAQNDQNRDYVAAVKEMCRISLDRTFSSWKRFDALFRLTEDYRKQKRCLATLHGFTNTVIRTRKEETRRQPRKNHEEEEDEVGRKRRMAFLDLLLNAAVDGKPLTDEDVREEVDTFMFEGHDTTASGISFALYCLADHPEVQLLAREELKRIFGSDATRPATHQDLQDMKYLELVVKEALRLYPSVPLVARHVTQDVRYKDHTIPKDTMISLFIYGINRDPDYHDDPDEFRPERFSKDVGKRPFAFVPFSAGPRNCIGQKFAMLEMKSMISKILKNFELLPTNPRHELVLSNEAVLKSLNGVKIRLKKHNWSPN